MIPLCHFQSSFEVLTFCSDFFNSSGMWFRSSLHNGQLYTAYVFPCLLHCYSLKDFFFIRPPSVKFFSAPILLPRPASLGILRCLSVHASSVFLRSIAWIGSNHAPSLSSSHSCFAAHVFQLMHRCLLLKHLLHLLRADHSHVHHHQSFKHQGVPLWPLNAQVANLHMTSPAGPLSCVRVCNSKICFLLAFCCSLLHLPIHTLFAQKSVARVGKCSSGSTSFTSMKRDDVTDSFLPAAAICLLNFNLSVGEMPTAFPPHTPAGTKPLVSKFLTPVLIATFTQAQKNMEKENEKERQKNKGKHFFKKKT